MMFMKSGSGSSLTVPCFKVQSPEDKLVLVIYPQWEICGQQTSAYVQVGMSGYTRAAVTVLTPGEVQAIQLDLDKWIEPAVPTGLVS